MVELAKLRSKTPENLAIDQFAVEPASFHQPSIRSKPSAMILLCEPPAAVAGAKVENGCFVFQARSASFAPVGLEARAPNQHSGLACADQGHPRAALDANDLWVRGVSA